MAGCFEAGSDQDQSAAEISNFKCIDMNQYITCAIADICFMNICHSINQQKRGIRRETRQKKKNRRGGRRSAFTNCIETTFCDDL